MPDADVYIVNPTLNRANPADVAEAERSLKTPFPEGYAQFVTTLGQGLYCDFVRVYLPQRIVKENDAFRARVTEYFCWDEGTAVLEKDRVLESICIADTVDGDEVIFHPSSAAGIYLLPHESEEIYAIGATFDEALSWILDSGTLTAKSSLRTFDSGIGLQSITLVSVKKTPTFARLKAALLKWGLHDQVDEVAESRRSRLLRVYLRSIGGAIHCSGTGTSYRLAVWHSVSPGSGPLEDVLGRLADLGFVPPEDESGNPHPAIAAIVPGYFKFEGIVPCPIPPERRQPRDVVLAFIRAMHAWETGMGAWHRTDYPYQLGFEFVQPIFDDLGVPAQNQFSYSVSIPSDYDPEKEEITEERTASPDEVHITTQLNDPFETEHSFVVRRKDGIWRLEQVRRKSGGSSSEVI